MFPLSPIGWFNVSYWSEFMFSMVNTDSRNSANMSHTIHIMKLARPSSICVHDVAGKSGINYPHDEGA